MIYLQAWITAKSLDNGMTSREQHESIPDMISFTQTNIYIAGQKRHAKPL